MHQYQKNELVEVVADIIKGIDLVEDRINRLGFDNQSARFLKFCLEEEIIQHGTVLYLVEVRLSKIAKRQADMSARGTWADHVSSPHALAYAIQHGEFSPKELRKIRFDHGDTAETFMKGKVDDLVDKIMKDLVTEVERIPTASDPNEVTCADGGPCVA